MTALFTQRCDFVKRNVSLDDVGNSTYTNETVYSNIKCRLDTVRLRSVEDSQVGANQSIFRSIIYTEYKANITNDMRVLFNGKYYNIISNSEVTGMNGNHHLQIELVISDNV
jgi:SPP1 family predicted phage head-tail adaptor